MRRIIFECYELRNSFLEEMEFDDETTDEEIEQEWKEWVWDLIRDNYGWYEMKEDK